MTEKTKMYSDFKVKIKKPYEGFARQILKEESLDDIVGPLYEIVDADVQAYILNQDNAEVKTSFVESLFVPGSLFRVASFPRVKKELLKSRPWLEQVAKDAAYESLRKQEDARLFTLLSSAIKDYEEHKDHVVSKKHIFPTHPDYFDERDVQDALKAVRSHEIDPVAVLCNSTELDEVKKIESLANLNIIDSIMVPQGSLMILPDKEYLGVLPVFASPEENDNHMEGQFYKGWVVDELIGMLVLNPRGLAAVYKYKKGYDNDKEE